MKKTISLSIVTCVALLCLGCGPKLETGADAKPTLKLEGMTLEQKIAAVEADKTIPPDYKQTYITSLKAKAAAAQNGGSAPAK